MEAKGIVILFRLSMWSAWFIFGVRWFNVSMLHPDSRSYGPAPDSVTTEEWYKVKMGAVPPSLKCIYIKKEDGYKTTGPRVCDFDKATSNALSPLRRKSWLFFLNATFFLNRVLESCSG